MLVLTIHVDRPVSQSQGIKEQIAQDLERYGDVKVVSIKEIAPKQMSFEEYMTPQRNVQKF